MNFHGMGRENDTPKHRQVCRVLVMARWNEYEQRFEAFTGAKLTDVLMWQGVEDEMPKTVHDTEGGGDDTD